MNLVGLRATALLIVIAAHFAAAAPFHAYFVWFAIAGSGVGMLFLMSGFAINFALEHAPNAGYFWRRRFARLFPAMVICSLTTVAVLTLLGVPNAPGPLDLIPSWTFITPAAFGTLFGRPLAFVDMVYWCLWVEVQFYLIAGLVHYSSWRARLPEALFALYVTLGLAAKALAMLDASLGLGGGAIAAQQWLIVFAPVGRFASYFLIGLLLARAITARLGGRERAMLFTAMAAEIAYPLAAGSAVASLFVAFLFGLFCWGMFTARGTAVFSTRLLAPIAYASYPLFLLHCSIGKAVIETSGARGLAALSIALAVLAGLIAYAAMVQRFVADPARRRLLGTARTRPNSAGAAALG